MNEADYKKMRNIKGLADKAFVAGYLAALDDLNKSSGIVGVMFDPPKTTIVWEDDTFTSVTDADYVPDKENLDPKWHERGMAFAICKRFMPNYVSIVEDWCSKTKNPSQD